MGGNISKLLERLNKHSFTFDGQPVRVRFIDSLLLEGKDFVTVHFMFDDEAHSGLLFKDSWQISRYLFEGAYEANEVAVQEFDRALCIFIEKIRMGREHWEYQAEDFEEIEI